MLIEGPHKDRNTILCVRVFWDIRETAEQRYLSACFSYTPPPPPFYSSFHPSSRSFDKVKQFPEWPSQCESARCRQRNICPAPSAGHKQSSEAVEQRASQRPREKVLLPLHFSPNPSCAPSTLGPVSSQHAASAAHLFVQLFFVPIHIKAAL